MNSSEDILTLIPQFLFLVFLGALFIGLPVYIWLDSRGKERDAADAIKSFLTSTYPEASIGDDHATFVHGRLRCSLEWHYHAARDNHSRPSQCTVLSFRIPDWMAQALAGKGFDIDSGLPHQFFGFLVTTIPAEYNDFIEGRMKGRVPSVPFVNAESQDKALEEALQHDLTTYEILGRADSPDPRQKCIPNFVPTSFALKGDLFSAKIPKLIQSEKGAKALIHSALAMLKRVYLVACHVDGVQPVDRETFDAYFNRHGRFLDRPDDSAEAVVDELERELAAEGDAPGDDGDATKALGGATKALGDGGHDGSRGQRRAPPPPRRES